MKLLKLLPIIGISILICIIYKVGLISLIRTLVTAEPYYIFLTTVFMFVSVSVLALKWYAILKTQGINVNFLYALKIYFIGIFYGAITPARSGSLIRASYLKDKTNKSFGKCLSGIILERLMDMFALFVYSIIGCIVFLKYISNYLPIILVSFVIFLFLSLLLLKKNLNRLFLKFIYKFLIPQKFKDKSKELYEAFYKNMPSIKNLFCLLIFTFITWVILSIYTYYAARAYSVSVSLFYIVLIFSISTVISLIPITIGGLGTREATLIFLFSFFNVEAAKVVAISFLTFFANMIPPFIGFLISLREPQPEKLI